MMLVQWPSPAARFTPSTAAGRVPCPAPARASLLGVRLGVGWYAGPLVLILALCLLLPWAPVYRTAGHRNTGVVGRVESLSSSGDHENDRREGGSNTRPFLFRSSSPSPSFTPPPAPLSLFVFGGSTRYLQSPVIQPFCTAAALPATGLHCAEQSTLEKRPYTHSSVARI